LSEKNNGQITDILEKLSEQLNRMENEETIEDELAILWDVENVNPGNDASFIEGFSEYISQFGRQTVAQAFANWARKPIEGLSHLLSEHHFELIHVPAARKNSADMSLITYGIELALQYPHLKTFVLVTGDSDFRPLVKSLRRNGKKIIIICDMKTARADFLILADEFIDYRTLRTGNSTKKDHKDEEKKKEEKGQKKTTKEKERKKKKQEKKIREEKRGNAYNLLTEAITEMKEEKLKPSMGLVKVRLLMLNPNFNEKELGFPNWSSFVNKAKEEGYIQISKEGGGLILDVAHKKRTKTDQEKAFEMLLDVLKNNDEGLKPKFHNQSIIAEELYKKSEFDELKKKLGFKKFKDFVQAAEVRELVETEVDGLTHSIRRIKKK
jgi:hypothetical protein